MNNVKRLADALISWHGEQVVIALSEPIYITRNQQKFPLVKKCITQNELMLLRQELELLTGGAEKLVIDDKCLIVEPFEEGFSIKLLPTKELQILDTQPNQESEAGNQIETQQNLDHRPQEADESKETIEMNAISNDEISQVENWETIDDLLELMVKMKASDLHLSSNCSPYLRIDGDMMGLNQIPPICSDELWRRLLEITPKRNQDEFINNKDTDFAYEIDNLGRFRSNIFFDHRGIGAVFRLIPSQILSTETLKIPQTIIDLCSMPKGLILVTGPTGSGKSTTLAALIDYINHTQKKHIITIEDPVEFVHPNLLSLINQREVHSHTESFKKALRAALREDPDIILVGEMRDLETISIAIEMAVTGHLVLGTLHTATAVSTVDRIIDQFPANQQAQIRSMLADALIGVISQMLLKKKEGGRVAAYEVMVANVAVSNLIREGKTYQIATIMQTGKKLGQQMINSHLCHLVNSGLVDADEALKNAIDKENLKAMLRGAP